MYCWIRNSHVKSILGGIAQSIAQVPAGTGLIPHNYLGRYNSGFNFIFNVYGRRIKRNPQLSPVYEIDQVRRQELEDAESEHLPFTFKHKVILASILVCLAAIVVGVYNLDLEFQKLRLSSLQRNYLWIYWAFKFR